MKLFQKGELKILWPFYLEYFFASSLYFFPAFLVLYLSQLSFSFTQIGILVAIIPLTALIFEIPTGAIADLYGRKFSVILGYSLEGICMLFLFFAKTYFSVFFIFLLWGLGTTFSSGSKDAWIVDMINKNNKRLVHNFFTKMQVFIGFGLIISGFIGVMFVKYCGVRVIWIIGVFSYLVSILLLSTLTKKDNVKSVSVKIQGSFRKVVIQSKEAISYGYKHPVLFYYLFAALLLALIGSLVAGISWTPFLKGLGFPDSYFGYMWSGMGFFSILGPIIASKLLKKGKERNFIIISLVISAITILFVLLPQKWIFVLIILFLFSLFFSMGNPASEVYFHRFIFSKMRATMGSVRSMIVYIGGIIGMVLAGFLIDLIGARYTIVLFAPLTILVIVLYLKIKEQKPEDLNYKKSKGNSIKR